MKIYMIELSIKNANNYGIADTTVYFDKENAEDVIMYWRTSWGKAYDYRIGTYQRIDDTPSPEVRPMI
jgi:hypothetical protein